MTAPEVDPVRARLAEITTRAEKATDGPWSAADEHGLIPGATPAWCISRMRPGFETMSESGGYLYDIAEIAHEDSHSPADAEFIAAARTDVPSLVAAVNAVLEKCEKAENRPFRGIDFSGKPFPVHVDSGELRAAVAAALGVTE